MVLIILGLSSCKHELPVPPVQEQLSNENPGGGTGQEVPCDPNIVYFEQQVLPIIVSNCTKSGCHNTLDHADGITLTSYSTIMNDGDIRQGNPGNSKLFKVISTTDPDDIMPPQPNSALTQTQINLISLWIQQGAINNSCQSGCDTANVTYNGTIQPIIQSSCIGCHSGNTPAGSINLSTFSGVKNIAINGSLFGSVNHELGYSPMPKGGNSLSNCQISEIKIWIDLGSINN